jgi:predicted dehydrogenase
MKKPLLPALFIMASSLAWSQGAPPVRIAIVGLVHDHARGMIPRFSGRGDVELVGIVEPNQELAASYEREFHLAPGLFYPSIDALVAKTKVRAVAIFTSTYGHRAVVEKCASLGLDVMMEKPLATSLAHALAMAAAAKKGGIHLLVNYETTWYSANQAAYKLIWEQNAIGDLRKFVVHDGHEGPKAIGCSAYFLDWLTDPVLNGGGVTMDFGCYGADMVTWLMDGQRPTSVFSVAQHFQPEAYPKVEDEATIVVTYPRAQAIIQASWNWPFDRKDMEIYGQRGSLMLPNRSTLLMRQGRGPETAVPAPAPKAPYGDPLSYLAAVARGEIKPSGPSSIAVNLVVCEILDAARESARTGRRIDFAAAAPQ